MFTLLISIVAFFVLITGLIIIHELGHFTAARIFGVHVEEFGLGLPPKVCTMFKEGGTNFTFNAVPVGGFVRLKGETGSEGEVCTEPGSFTRASIPARAIILLAGVLMNFLVAFGIYVYGFSVGQWVPTYLALTDMQDAARSGDIRLELGVVVSEILPDGGAERAKIPAGSVLLMVDGTKVSLPEDVLRLQVDKKMVRYTYLPTPDASEPQIATVAVSEGKTGVYLRIVPRELSAPRRGLLTGTAFAGRELWVVTKETVLGIVHLIASLAQKFIVPKEVTGIIGIAQLTYSSVQQGISTYLRLMAVISLNLAVLNVLPFPALDGGRIVFLLGELFVRPKKRKVENVINRFGLFFLLFLILLVTIYDVLRTFRH